MMYNALERLFYGVMYFTLGCAHYLIYMSVSHKPQNEKKSDLTISRQRELLCRAANCYFHSLLIC